MIAPLATEVHRRLGDLVFTLDDETLEASGLAATAGVAGDVSRAPSRSRAAASVLV